MPLMLSHISDYLSKNITKNNFSGAWGHKLNVIDYQILLNGGWRRFVDK